MRVRIDVASLRRRTAVAVAVVAACSAVTVVAAQEGPVAANVTLFRDSSRATTGTCVPYTATVTTQAGQPVQGATVDVLQVMEAARIEPEENRELYFCDPSPSHTRNPTGGGATQVRDVTGNNPSQNPGELGRNTRVHAEAGPTDANGDVTFGIAMGPDLADAGVTLTAWVDLDGDDQRDEGEPWDGSLHHWLRGDGTVLVIDAGPEGDVNPNGTTHTVTVAVATSNGAPLQGFVPKSVILPTAFGQPPGDVVDQNAGASPNAAAKGNADVYACTPSDSHGLSTCTFEDPASTPAGTDTIVFFSDRGGEARWPDGDDPRDAVQKQWMPAPSPPPSAVASPTSSPTPPPSASPSPSPSAPPLPAAARYVVLCSGATVAPCDTSFRVAEPGDDVDVAALVTDRYGNPVPNVPVELREAGPAVFTPSGADAILPSTGADGVARGTLTSSRDEGTSTVVAEISPPGTPGSFRGPGAADDECEQPAGPGEAPPAGNCTSRPLTVYWEEAINGHECDDALDNDGDGYVDYPEDPGCTDEQDGTEDPFDPPPLGRQERHPRVVSMRFRDGAGEDGARLRVFGRVRLENENDGFLTCRRGQRVLIQRRSDGEWITKEEAWTNARGRYAGVVRDRPGRYRAVAPIARVVLEEENKLHVCMRAEKVKPHRHRR